MTRQSTCREYEPLIEQMLAEEIGDADRMRLFAHAQACTACREFVDLHLRLLEPGSTPALPTDGEFAAMRGEVLREIRADRAADASALWSRVLGWFGASGAGLTPFHAAAALALCAVLFLGGYYSGSRPIVISDDLDLGNEAQLTRALYQEASTNRGFDEIVESPYVYRNVSFRELADGDIELTFDVTSHMQLRQSPDHPLVREILVQSLMERGSVGTRLDAVSLASRVMNPGVQQALVVAMLEDPNQAVRMRALQNLADFRDEADVQSAMLAVLRGEESVQMRLFAMETLASSDLSDDRLTRALDDLGSDPALLVRAAGHGLSPSPSAGE